MPSQQAQGPAFKLQYQNNNKKAGNWWLIPVILTTSEAEISRIIVQSQLRQQLSKIVYACHPSDWGKFKIGESQLRLA
jgi:hypothetical protein